MGGCCCTPRGAGPTGTPTYTHSEEHEPLASPQDTSTISVGVPIDTALVTSDLDTFRAPPAPLPFDVEPRHVTQADGSLESSEKQDCKVQTDSETDASKLVDDEPLKLDKSVDSTIDEEDDCPICLEDYDNRSWLCWIAMVKWSKSHFRPLEVVKRARMDGHAQICWH